MTIVFKLSDNLKTKAIAYYAPLKKEKTPPYAVFQAVDADTVVTLYESGKIMFQGTSADIDADIWITMERKLNNRIIDPGKKEKEKKEDKKTFLNCDTVGSDEVGTGDYFGPIVVSATNVTMDNMAFLSGLGVRDSKKLTDDKIKEIAPLIMEKIPYVTYILDNKTYNEFYSTSLNMNKIKAILHNKVLINLIKKDDIKYDKIVIDQFEVPKSYFNHLSEAKEVIRNITFMTKAEDQVLSVACASIISRYVFLKEMQKLNTKYNKILPLGASNLVDEAALELVKQNGIDVLKDIAKINFKNTEKIKSMM